MRKLYYIWLLILPLLALVSCQNEGVLASEEELVDMTYQVKLDDDGYSRAIGDGSQINELVVGVFETRSNQLIQIMRKRFPVNDLFAKVTLQLLKTRTYHLVFWAQTKDNGVYDTDKLNDIRINYDQFQKTQFQGFALDAFYAVRTGVKVLEPGSTSIVLKRPFAQMGFGVYGSEEEKGKISSVEILVNNSLYTGFKPLDIEENAVVGNAQSYAFTFTELTDKSQEFSIDGKNYTFLTANYFLVPTASEETMISGSVKYLDTEGNVVSAFDFTDVSLLRNTRINIGKELDENGI